MRMRKLKPYIAESICGLKVGSSHDRQSTYVYLHVSYFIALLNPYLCQKCSEPLCGSLQSNKTSFLQNV